MNRPLLGGLARPFFPFPLSRFQAVTVSMVQSVRGMLSQDNYDPEMRPPCRAEVGPATRGMGVGPDQQISDVRAGWVVTACLSGFRRVVQPVPSSGACPRPGRPTWVHLHRDWRPTPSDGGGARTVRIDAKGSERGAERRSGLNPSPGGGGDGPADDALRTPCGRHPKRSSAGPEAVLLRRAVTVLRGCMGLIPAFSSISRMAEVRVGPPGPAYGRSAVAACPRPTSSGQPQSDSPDRRSDGCSHEGVRPLVQSNLTSAPIRLPPQSVP